LRLECQYADKIGRDREGKVIIDFRLSSSQIAKVDNGVLDIFGPPGPIGAKKNGEREGMKCLINVWEWDRCIPEKWEG
jgi:hypothetical protein